MENHRSYHPRGNPGWYGYPSTPGAIAPQGHPMGALTPQVGAPATSHLPQPIGSAQHNARYAYYHPADPVYQTNSSGNRISPRSQRHGHETGRTEYDNLPPLAQPVFDHHSSDNEELPTTRQMLESVGRSAGARADLKTGEAHEVPAPVGKTKPSQTRQTKAVGKGSRSGTNRRAQGNSDDEMEKLSIKKAEEVAATGKEFWSDEDKIKAIKFICEPERFVTFKATQAHDFQTVSLTVGFKNMKTLTLFILQISQKLLEGRKSQKQVAQLWSSQWDKYKAVRRRQQHTGGGDGDESDGDSESDPENVTEAALTVGKGETADLDLGHNCKPAMKRKRTTPSMKKSGRFSHKVLDKFEQSEVYKIIDGV